MGIKTLYRPEAFQGNMKRKNYFEGYFFKLVSEDNKNAISIIPGICLNEEDSHAYIQILDTNGRSYYIKYALKEFSYNSKTLFIQIGENIFTQSYVRLNITEDNLTLCGIIWFDNLQTVDNKWWRPGIMGPFRFVPYMECYHGVISMNHNLKGTLILNHKPIKFTDGKGYIEKDWGTNFPKGYVWMQSNHFVDPNLSVMLSIAQIPWRRKYFTGFIGCIAIADKIRIFSTYTGAKITNLEIIDTEVLVEIKQGKEKLEIRIEGDKGKELMAPESGMMKRKVYETLNAKMELKLFYRDKLMTHQYTTVAAIEIAGQTDLLYKA